MSDYNEDTMERMATLASTAYLPSLEKRQKEADSYYNGEYELLKEYSNKHHSTFRNKKTDDIILAVRGTDFSNSQGGKISDLATDALVTFGLETLGTRYKKSDEMVKKLKEKYPNNKLILSGHSLAGSLVQELGYKHDLEAHSFAAGATPLSANVKKHKVLHPDIKRKRDKNHTYIVMPSMKGTLIDPISFSNALHPFVNTHWIKPKKLSKKDQGILFHHSIEQFKGEKAVM